jgi:hypothetical protein
MRSWIKHFIDSCDTCNRSKPLRQQKSISLQPLPNPPRPWSGISLDFIVKLPISSSFDSILVVTDRLTKMVHFFPCNETITAADTALLIFNSVFRYHGIPDSIVSDRGPQFTAHFWKRFLNLLNCTANLSTAFHPETNGQTERTNQVLEQYLRSYSNYHQTNWSALLPSAEFTYNNTIHSSIGQTPFFANYGFHPKSDFLAATASHVPAAEQLIDHLHDIQSQLQETLLRAKSSYKKFADRHRRPTPLFHVHDKVWFNRKNLATARPSNKLDSVFLGPYRILEKIGSHAVRLDFPASIKIHPVVHVSLLKKYVANSIPSRLPTPPPPVLIANTRHYEVERILDSRRYYGKIQYLIQWKNYDASNNSWEPASDPNTNPQEFARESEFHRHHPLRPHPPGRLP